MPEQTLSDQVLQLEQRAEQAAFTAEKLAEENADLKSENSHLHSRIEPMKLALRRILNEAHHKSQLAIIAKRAIEGFE